MDKDQVEKIVNDKLDSLEKSALKGLQRTGYITNTHIVIACSPGKITIVFPVTKEYKYIKDIAIKRGHQSGRYDGKKMSGVKFTQLTKIVDKNMEQEFYDKEYINTDPDNRRKVQ